MGSTWWSDTGTSPHVAAAVDLPIPTAPTPSHCSPACSKRLAWKTSSGGRWRRLSCFTACRPLAQLQRGGWVGGWGWGCDGGREAGEEGEQLASHNRALTFAGPPPPAPSCPACDQHQRPAASPTNATIQGHSPTNRDTLPPNTHLSQAHFSPVPSCSACVKRLRQPSRLAPGQR